MLYFKQYGALSGGSLVHPHMQVVSLPLLTPETHNRLERAWNHYHKLGECAVCKARLPPLPSDVRISGESTDSLALSSGKSGVGSGGGDKRLAHVSAFQGGRPKSPHSLSNITSDIDLE